MLKLAPACSCSKCSTGCRFGSGLLVDGDAERISAFLGVSTEELKEKLLEEVELFNTKQHRPKLIRNNKPYGACTFYDEEHGCIIHKVKPLQCKTSMGCKEYGSDLTTWFYANFVVNPRDSESLEQWEQYLKQNKPIKGVSVHELTHADK